MRSGYLSCCNSRTFGEIGGHKVPHPASSLRHRHNLAVSRNELTVERDNDNGETIILSEPTTTGAGTI